MFQFFIFILLQEGDRVFFSGASGSYAEYVACESHSVFHLADRLSFAQGAALGVPYFTAYRAIFIKYKSFSTFTFLLFSIQCNSCFCSSSTSIVICYAMQRKGQGRRSCFGSWSQWSCWFSRLSNR